jgi:hypothetical protein
MSISSSLYQRLQQTLLRCGPFDSGRALRPLFFDERLSPWRDWLPEASSRAQRVQLVIETLGERYNPQGENALVLFLRALSDYIPSGNSCHHELAALAGEVAEAMRQTAPPLADAPPAAGATEQDENHHLASGDASVGGDVHGDLVTGQKSTVFDQRGQQGQQTSVAGDYIDRRQGTTYVTNIEHAEGLAIGDGARVVQPEPRGHDETVPPTVTVALLTEIVPTATCHQLDAQRFPLATVGLDNARAGGADIALRVTAHIEDYSDRAVESLRVPQGKQMRVGLLPLLKPTAVETLHEMRPATLHVTVAQTAPVERLLYDRTHRIRLHARDTALLALRAPDGSITDRSDYLAAWVTPRHPEIEKLLRQAAEHHPDRQFVGYQGAQTLAQGADVVRAQARAIFEALKQDANVVYVNSPLNMGREAGQVTQRVRLPVESLAAGGSANCIDGTVLFASLLELASITPLLILVPGHAFVGWRIWQSVDQYEFLETTMIGSDTFAAAQQAGRRRYEAALMRGDFNRGLFDPAGFARLVDVAACRAKGVMPLM